MNVQCALDCRSLLGEGPVWDVREQRLYWVDIKRRQIHRFAPDTGADEIWLMPEDIGALAPREGGGLVVALKSGFYFYDLIETRLVPAALTDDEPEHNRFNDGKADRQGRFWAGTMDEHEKLPTGGLFRLQPNLDCHRMIDGIICSNALCWSPDSRVMYHADSGQRTVWAWDFDPATGEIDNAAFSSGPPSRTAFPTAPPSTARASCGSRSGAAGASCATILRVASPGRSCCRLRSRPVRCSAAPASTLCLSLRPQSDLPRKRARRSRRPAASSLSRPG